MKSIILLVFLPVFFYQNSIAQNFIAFRAIPAGDESLAGHAWVTFITKDKAQQQTRIEEAWGFYPEKKSLMALFSEKGVLKDENTLSLKNKESPFTPWKYDVIIQVDDINAYEDCKRMKNGWITRQYGIVSNYSCVDYLKEISGRLTDVKVPNTFYKYPKDFLIRLKQLNVVNDMKSRNALSSPGGPPAENLGRAPVAKVTDVGDDQYRRNQQDDIPNINRAD